jgi:hypothetical protein
MTNPPPPPDPVTTTEIADLLSWARRLSTARGGATPAQRAAYLAAKADLLTRITGAHADEHPCHADQTRTVASRATALHQPDKDTP